jgi:hypothetical protein
MAKQIKSIVSNLPISMLETISKEYKILAILSGKKMRIRYRGPRFDSMRLHTLKRDAVRFSVYFV